jgi:hypothetical protein
MKEVSKRKNYKGKSPTVTSGFLDMIDALAPIATKIL